MSLVPYVLEQTSRGERSYDLYSRLLKDRITETQKRLDALRQAQAQLDDDPAVDKTSQDYMELRREIITTESQIKHFEAELKKIDNINFERVGKQLKTVGDKAASVGQSLTRVLTVPIIGAYTASSKLASDYEENLNKIDAAAFGSLGSLEIHLDYPGQINNTKGAMLSTNAVIYLKHSTTFKANNMCKSVVYRFSELLSLSAENFQTTILFLRRFLKLELLFNFVMSHVHYRSLTRSKVVYRGL